MGNFHSIILENKYKEFSECLHSKLLQLYMTLGGPGNRSPPSSSVRGILQAIVLEWVALLWEIFSTQGSNLPLLHWQVDSLPLSHYNLY